MERTLTEKQAKVFLRRLKITNCHFCGKPLPKTIKGYDHLDGWRVDGIEKKQWLFITCPNCKYDWSIWKLGVGKE